MPAHSHTMVCYNGTDNIVPSPESTFIAQNSNNIANFEASTDNTKLNTKTVSLTGNGQPFTLMQPYIGLYIIIATSGVFPSRN